MGKSANYASNNGMNIKHDNVRMKGIVLDLHDVNLNKLPYIGHFSVLTQNKIFTLSRAIAMIWISN